MQLEDLIDREAIIEGVARGTKLFLTESKAGEHLRELVEIIGNLHLLKAGVLTSDQAADLLGLARSTFGRKVAEGKFRRRTIMGHAEPRHLLAELIEDLLREEAKETGVAIPHSDESLKVVDMPGSSAVKRRRGRPRLSDAAA